MAASELRILIKKYPSPISFLSYETQVERPRLLAFIKGDDRALSTQEQQSICDLLIVGNEAGSKNLASHRAVVDGVAHNLQKHSVAFFTVGKDGNPEIGSGTLIKIDEALLIATARHLIRKTPMLQFVGDNLANFEIRNVPNDTTYRVCGGTNVEVLKWGKHEHYDVGFFELDRNGSDVLKREPIELSRVSTQPQQFGRVTFVYGYPRQLVHLPPTAVEMAYVPIGSITYPAPLLVPEEWPTLPADARPADENVDYFVPYDMSDEMIKVEPAGQFKSKGPYGIPNSLPEAYGMSGGGFWQSWIESGELWNPGDYKLTAIQSSWLSESGYLRAIQARHWLDLVHDECPKLRSTVDAHRYA